MRITIGILALFIVFLLLILACLTLYIVFRNKSMSFSDNKKKEYLNKVSPHWHDYLVRGHEILISDLVPKNKEEIQAVEQIFISYVKNLSNREVHAKIKWFSNHYLYEYYTVLLKSRKWSLRMNALYRIADFQIDRLLDDCRLLEERGCSHEELLQIYKIYSLLDYEHLLKKIKNKTAYLTGSEYRRLFHFISEDCVKAMISLYKELPRACQLSIIDTLGYRRSTEFVPFLEKQLLLRDQEIRIRTLKAIYETGWVIAPEKYVHFVQSPLWEERLMVTKLMGRLPLEEAFPYFQRLLEDESWWVRAEAAKTAGKIKWGKEKLREFVETTSDRYAMEMVNEVLRKGTK